VEVARRALDAITPLSGEEWARLRPFIVRRRLGRREAFLSPGEVARSVAVVVHGVVRELFLSPDGREHNKAFCLEGELTGSLADLIAGRRGAPALARVEALEPTELAAFPVDAAAAALGPRWDYIARISAEALLERKARREHALLTRSPEERWIDLTREAPHWVARIPLRHLASFLGITPEALSRIRRRVAARAP
jgi:CRP-like cAMP-binding protein